MFAGGDSTREMLERILASLEETRTDVVNLRMDMNHLSREQMKNRARMMELEERRSRRGSFRSVNHHVQPRHGGRVEDGNVVVERWLADRDSYANPKILVHQPTNQTESLVDRGQASDVEAIDGDFHGENVAERVAPRDDHWLGPMHESAPAPHQPARDSRFERRPPPPHHVPIAHRDPPVVRGRVFQPRYEDRFQQRHDGNEGNFRPFNHNEFNKFDDYGAYGGHYDSGEQDRYYGDQGG